jgi:hypothetical protein
MTTTTSAGQKVLPSAADKKDNAQEKKESSLPPSPSLASPRNLVSAPFFPATSNWGNTALFDIKIPNMGTNFAAAAASASWMRSPSLAVKQPQCSSSNSAASARLPRFPVPQNSSAPQLK